MTHDPDYPLSAHVPEEPPPDSPALRDYLRLQRHIMNSQLLLQDSIRLNERLDAIWLKLNPKERGYVVACSLGLY